MNQFQQVYLSINLYGFRLISWQMDGTHFKPTTSVSFYIDKARSGGEWTNIAGPIVDDCFYTDVTPWDWAKEYNSYYRVRYLSGTDWIYSTPVQASSNWGWTEWKTAKEIIRKEYLVMRLGGQQGILLKRKEWGVPCPDCRDFDSREVTNKDCLTCFGTGITGGYYSPIDMPVWSVTPIVSKTKMISTAGTLQPAINNARIVAYPLISTFDVWCDSGSGERWFIDGVKPVSEIKGTPVVEMVEMKLKPFTDICYSVSFNVLANKIPVAQPTGTEHTWSRQLDCIP